MTLTATSTITPEQALASLLAPISPVDHEQVPLSMATGRVLAKALIADRPSPAIDVSAMDGFAMRLADISMTAIPIAGELSAGQPPMSLSPHTCLRIATGAAIPVDADFVVPREHVTESKHSIAVHPDRVAMIRVGAHIRREGENASIGAYILQPGAAIHAPAAAALATFGVCDPAVFRRVRISVIVTGDEVNDDRGPSEPPISPQIKPWLVRDSNGPAMTALFASFAWADVQSVSHVRDDLIALCTALQDATTTSDMVILTGGVAVGHKDFVPAVLDAIGARTLFHGVAQKPGRPFLGAFAGNCPVLCLPGNPVSVMITARRYAIPVARALAGFSIREAPAESVRLIASIEKPSALTRFIAVRHIEPGFVRALEMRGSGDCVGLGPSNGFVEIPANQTGIGPWNFFNWN